MRLRLNLAYARFLNDQKGDVEEATRAAKGAFDDAIAELDSLPEDSYTESTLVMQQLRDALTMWTEEENDMYPLSFILFFFAFLFKMTPHCSPARRKNFLEGEKMDFEEESEEEYRSLVVDIGFSTVKAGMAGDDAPRAVFPCKRELLCTPFVVSRD